MDNNILFIDKKIQKISEEVKKTKINNNNNNIINNNKISADNLINN